MGWSDIDITYGVRELGDVHPPDADWMVLVCDWVKTLAAASL